MNKDIKSRNPIRDRRVASEATQQESKKTELKLDETPEHCEDCLESEEDQCECDCEKCNNANNNGYPKKPLQTPPETKPETTSKWGFTWCRNPYAIICIVIVIAIAIRYNFRSLDRDELLPWKAEFPHQSDITWTTITNETNAKRDRASIYLLPYTPKNERTVRKFIKHFTEWLVNQTVHEIGNTSDLEMPVKTSDVEMPARTSALKKSAVELSVDDLNLYYSMSEWLQKRMDDWMSNFNASRVMIIRDADRIHANVAGVLRNFSDVNNTVIVLTVGVLDLNSSLDDILAFTNEWRDNFIGANVQMLTIVPEPTEVEKTMHELRAAFPNQERDTYTSLHVGLSNFEETFIFIFVHSKQSEATALKLAKFYSAAYNRLKTKSNGTLLDVTSTYLNENYASVPGRFIDDFRVKLQQSGSMIIERLHEIPGRIAAYFHSLCDEYNPVVKGSVIIFTMLMEEDASVGAVNERLSELWSDMDGNNLDALIVRLTGAVVKIV